MSGFDIEALRLRDDERRASDWSDVYLIEIADAQLAKALWGVYDWFENLEGDSLYKAETWLLYALEQANIERLADTPSKTPSNHPR